MENKMYLFSALARLTPDNVDEIYNIEFTKWRYLNSSEVVVNGKKVDDNVLKQLLMQPDEKGGPNIKDCTVNDRDGSGFELEEQLFINEQIAKFRPLLEKSKGSALNRGYHLKIRAYIEYLENLAKPTEPIIDKEVLAAIFQEYKHLFDERETEWNWVKRFVNDGRQREPFVLNEDNKIYVMAILDVIQNKIPNNEKSYGFDNLIENNFGLKFYKQTKSRIKKKNQTRFKEICSEVKNLIA
jgi:hypothetical protein